MLGIFELLVIIFGLVGMYIPYVVGFLLLVTLVFQLKDRNPRKAMIDCSIILVVGLLLYLCGQFALYLIARSIVGP